MAQIVVKKDDGTLEPLNPEKIRQAILRSGASKALSFEVLDEIQPKFKNGMSTKEIYRLAFETLQNLRPGAAARFSLKGALAKLGPEGYPFETFIGAILKGRGYQTRLRQILQGRCVSHEIDVVAHRDATGEKPRVDSIIECKFHNMLGTRCHIQSALYSWARYLDVSEANPHLTSSWLVTNTKFTTETIKYADCVGLKLLGWGFPASESIQVRIEENKLYPITILTRLDRWSFNKLHNAGIILVPELLKADYTELSKTGMPQKTLDGLLVEARQAMSQRY